MRMLTGCGRRSEMWVMIMNGTRMNVNDMNCITVHAAAAAAAANDAYTLNTFKSTSKK